MSQQKVNTGLQGKDTGMEVGSGNAFAAEGEGELDEEALESVAGGYYQEKAKGDDEKKGMRWQSEQAKGNGGGGKRERSEEKGYDIRKDYQHHNP